MDFIINVYFLCTLVGSVLVVLRLLYEAIKQVRFNIKELGVAESIGYLLVILVFSAFPLYVLYTGTWRDIIDTLF